MEKYYFMKHEKLQKTITKYTNHDRSANYLTSAHVKYEANNIIRKCLIIGMSQDMKELANHLYRDHILLASNLCVFSSIYLSVYIWNIINKYESIAFSTEHA